MVYIQNLQDGSLMLGPSVEYAISDEVRLSFVALIPLGAGVGWDTSSIVPEIQPRSEYGLGSQMYVVQLRASI